jgi:Fe-S oxidoreductase
MGYQPVVLPFSPNGKAQHIKGFLNRFAKPRRKRRLLKPRGAAGDPMVGVDPALVLCYRDEYKQTLGDKRGDFHVMLVHEWLPAALQKSVQEVSGESWYLFGHCTEVTALPGAPAQWASILPASARSWRASRGLLRHGGTYGHEVKNHANSLGIYELSWHQAMQRLPRNRCLATGYSCRSQVKRVEGNGVRHPLQALLEIMG